MAHLVKTCITLFALLPAIAMAQNSSDIKQHAIDSVEALRPQINAMSSSLWEYAELALQEHKSAELLIQQLEAAGFSVESGVAEMPTAFVATYGRGSPVIGILSEFDALPGVGNAPVPARQAREDGITSGHGCGHNLFGAGSVGGAIGLKEAMVQAGLKGTIKLFGAPAEETLVGKVYMAKAGVFDGLDAVIDWHPAVGTGINNQTGQAMNNFEVEFFGKPAHGALDPWNGRSALDAVETMNYSINLMREHIPPTARIHYVIPDGGQAPNVVPAYAKAWYYVRDISRAAVEEHYQRILSIAEGAALATGTTHKVSLITGVHEYLINRPLQEAVQSNLELIGGPEFSEEEQTFGRAMQKAAGKPEVGYLSDVAPLADEPTAPRGGSTDAAEVSWMTPTVNFAVATAALNLPWHSWATSASHNNTAAHKGAVVAAKVIAATGVDLLTNPGLVESAQVFFEQASEGKPYQSPVPLEQKPPL